MRLCVVRCCYFFVCLLSLCLILISIFVCHLLICSMFSFEFFLPRMPSRWTWWDNMALWVAFDYVDFLRFWISFLLAPYSKLWFDIRKNWFGCLWLLRQWVKCVVTVDACFDGLFFERKVVLVAERTLNMQFWMNSFRKWHNLEQ